MATAKQYNTSLVWVLWRAISLLKWKGIRRGEASLSGLFDPNLSFKTIRNHCIGRRHLFVLQRVHNDRNLADLTENKVVFYKKCMADGIIVPKLYGVYDPGTGWSIDDPMICDDTGWHKFFAETVPESFVIKPARGFYSRGLKVLNRTSGQGFLDTSGVVYDVAGLLSYMRGFRSFREFVIQQRIESHIALSELADTNALQTIRVVTFTDNSDPVPRILFAALKIIVGAKNISDNFQNGVSGNLLADVKLLDGQIDTVMGKHDSRFGLMQHLVHPLTGRSFSGFKIPYWAAVRELALEAALAFLPIQTIGWDIAVTPKGPVLIEGNMWWDPHNPHRNMDIYLALHDKP